MNFGDIMTFKELMKIVTFELAEIVIHYKDGKIQTMIVDHIPNSMGFFFKDFEELCRCSDKIKETYTGCNQYKTESY